LGNSLTITRSGPVATVTMTRPEVHNAFNEHLVVELRDAFTTLGADAGVRVIVLAGEGRSFSAGADLDWMRRMAEASEADNRADAQRLAAMLRAVAECPKPVVARVHGAAIGGGAGLVAACDIAIAAERARFGFSEVRLGIVPATIAPYVVAKIGAGRALPLFLLGERFDARFAMTIGLVYQVTADDLLEGAVESIVEALLLGGPDAQTVCKELVRHVGAQGWGPQREGEVKGIDAYTSELIARVRAGAEAREGVAAFLEKRKASWAADDRPPTVAN
jgi:methylglutaconyl-CoA hydratase